MNVQNSQANMAAVRFATELQKYPVEVAVGVGIVIPNLVNGCSWGFVTDTNEEYKRIQENIENNPNMSSFKIKNGYLFTINMDYLLCILSKVAGGFVTQKDLQIASEHRQESLVKIDKFLRKNGASMRKGEAVTIGIYNLNDSPRITISGKSYSAFCITLVDLLALCVRTGYNIRVNDKGKFRVLTPGQASNNVLKVVETLEVAPSGNALLIDLVKA